MPLCEFKNALILQQNLQRLIVQTVPIRIIHGQRKTQDMMTLSLLGLDIIYTMRYDVQSI